MKNKDLATYLNDHLAGSIGALDLLDRMIATYEEQPMAQFCREMRAEISADQDKLREIMKAIDVEESSLRKAGAWIMEKFSRAKLSLGDEEPADLGLVQALESLVLGIKGKEGLWRALTAVQPDWPELRQFDFARLERRAGEQGTRVDVERIQAATEAFRSGSDEVTIKK